MKKLIALMVTMAIIGVATTAAAARYQPVNEFMTENSTLSKWFKQYVDTTKGDVSFKSFLKKLSASEVLWQRSNRAGLTHNQLYSPIVTLLGQNFKNLDKLSTQERATIELSMLELDIALSAVDATLPRTAHEEFRREVIRGAKPLTEVAKLPKSAVEVMAFTVENHEVSDRLNRGKTPEVKSTIGAPVNINPSYNEPIPINPNLKSNYKPW